MQKPVTISVLVALVLHGLILCFFVAVIYLDIDFFKSDISKPKPDEKPEVTVVLRPQLSLPKPLPKPKPLAVNEPRLDAPPKTVPPKPEETPPPPAPIPKPSVSVKPEVTKPDPVKPLPLQKRRFARTSAEQAGKPDEPTDILGERDTQAASELSPTALNKPNTPSQEGVNPLRPGHLETVDSIYQDGSVGADQIGEETEKPQEASARKDSNTIDEAPKLEIPEPEQGSTAKARNNHLKEGTPLPNTNGRNGKSAIEDNIKDQEAPKEKPNEGSKKNGKNNSVEEEPKKNDFRGLSRKTRVTGSISRRGKSSLNVKNSPLGRYQALVSKAVELQWRRKCTEQRDHIVPGVISVRFYVDARGQVSGVKFQEVIGATYIMTGFTQRAIRASELPKMPKSVIKELGGESLELVYNFYF